MERSRAISSKVFVGNLNYETTQTQVTELFSEAGSIVDVYLPSDRNTGRPRGFAFVEFSSPEEAETAIEKFNDYEMAGRKLRVNSAEARPRGPRPSGPPMGGGGDFNPSFGPDAFGARPSKPKGSRRGRRGKKRSL